MPRDWASRAPEGSALLYGAVWSFRGARYEVLGRYVEATACYGRAAEWCPSLRAGVGTCENCGESRVLWALADPAARGDGGFIHACRPCFEAGWAHGRAHVPEAWEDEDTGEALPPPAVVRVAVLEGPAGPCYVPAGWIGGAR